jgi:hypothetical protein
MSTRRRQGLTIVAVAALVAAIAWPVLAASPLPGASGSPTPAASPTPAPLAAPTAGGNKGQSKTKEHEDETPVTVSGTVGTRTDADGATEYTLKTATTTLTLEAGPAWFYGDKHPLKPFVGKQVTVVGEQVAGSDELEVRSVDGQLIREPGRPPWAGGWKSVGKIHPGWSQAKQDRLEARLKAMGLDCWPPGHCKDKTKAKDDDETSPTPTPGG